MVKEETGPVGVGWGTVIFIGFPASVLPWAVLGFMQINVDVC